MVLMDMPPTKSKNRSSVFTCTVNGLRVHDWRINGRKNLPPSLRCFYCGTPLRNRGGREHGPTKDHVIPKSKGGAGLLRNKVRACCRCNEEKENLLFEDYRKKLIQENRLPAGLFFGESQEKGNYERHFEGGGKILCSDNG